MVNVTCPLCGHVGTVRKTLASKGRRPRHTCRKVQGVPEWFIHRIQCRKDRPAGASAVVLACDIWRASGGIDRRQKVCRIDLHHPLSVDNFEIKCEPSRRYLLEKINDHSISG